MLESRAVDRHRVAGQSAVIHAEMLGDDARAIFVARDPVGADRLALLILGDPLTDPKVERSIFRPTARRRGGSGRSGRRRRRLRHGSGEATIADRRLLVSLCDLREGHFFN